MTKPYANREKNKPIYNEFITPIGRIVHAFHDKPQLQTHEKTGQPVLDENGIQKADYKVTMWWPKTALDTILIPLRQLAYKTKMEAWPESDADTWFRLETFLRDGDNPEHNTKRKDYLMGGVYLNFKQKADATRLADGRVTYSGAPGLIGPHNEDILPTDVYPGCEARVSGIMFGTEYSGRNFISTRLNNIQLNIGGPWERLGGNARPDARSQFDPLAAPPLGGTAPGKMPNLL